MDVRKMLLGQCLLVFCLIDGVYLKKPELKLVHVVYRHGDRSPTKTFPSDRYQEDAWPQGFGQLSTIGMKTEFQLGEFLRKRYDGFLKTEYDRHEIKVRSTDVDRTLMSAQSVLAGLYPPSGEQVWNRNISWQPIPVHTVNLKEDPMLHMGGACPAYEHLYYSVLKSDVVKEYQRENKEFLDLLREKSGLHNASLYTLMEKIPDALFCEKQHNLTLDPWVTDELFDKIWDLKLMEFKIYFYTKKMTKYQAGVFLYTLVNQTKEYFEGAYKKGPKMFMYSAHDSTLAAILSGLGLWSYQIPPYSSCIMFELYENGPKEYSMQIWFRNSTTQDPAAEPFLLQLDDCSSDCAISQFYHLLEDMTIPGLNAWYEECGISSHDSKFNGNIVAIVISVVAVIVLFGIVFLMCYRRKRDYPYHSANFSDPQEA